MLRITTFLLTVFLAISVQAADIVKDPDAVKAIFNDKTAKANHLKRDRSWTNYFAADGTMKRVTGDGEIQTGKWHINDNAEHCIKWDHKNREFCRAIVKGKRDGVYFRVKLKGNRIVKLVRFKRFRDGNDLPK